MRETRAQRVVGRDSYVRIYLRVYVYVCVTECE